jgi:ribonuclease P protein component
VNSGPVVPETFSRDDRLRKRREFEECYASGVRVSGKHIQVFLLADLGDPARTRLGISVPRRVGVAVQRNRVRRRIREIFRRTRSLFGDNRMRVVVNARPSAASASFQELSEDYAAGVTRALSRLPRR